MTTVVGLLGFGRIGRNLFRLLYGRDDVRIGAISDWNEPEPLESLLRYDTLLGRFPDEVSIREGNLYVIGRQIRMITGKDQRQVPWGERACRSSAYSTWALPADARRARNG